MPSGITATDGMFSVRETPWHGEGVVLKKPPRTIDEAIKKASLDWTVEQYPVVAFDEADDSIMDLLKEVPDPEDSESTIEVPMFYANVRSDTGKALGVVTDRYKPVQNREAFSFLANIYGTEMHWETAGSLQGGRRVWVMLKLPEWVEVAGDPIAPYSFISNSHDGKSSVLAAVTPVRIVCQNTLALATSEAIAKYHIRHLGNMSQKMAEARNVLEVTVDYYEQFKAYGDTMGIKKLSDKRAKSALEQLFPIAEKDGERAARNKEEARAAVMSLFKTGSSPEVGYSPDLPSKDTRPQNALGTVWAFYNAATEYLDWGRSARKSRFQRVLDDPDGMKKAASAISLELAGLS
jgi:phage/plasmid-like protein (TIGR03299 family)